MHSAHNRPTSEAALWARYLSHVVLAVTAMIGIETTMLAASAGPRANRHVAVAFKTMVTAPNPIYDACGIMAVAGASVLVLAWLQRQASRASITICAPTEARLGVISVRPICLARKTTISHYLGGLYGP